MPVKPWTAKDNRKVLHLWRTGMPSAVIAQQFPDRTPHAVEQHAVKTLEQGGIRKHRKHPMPVAWSRIEGILRDHGPQSVRELAGRLHLTRRHITTVLKAYEGVTCHVAGVRTSERNKPAVWDIGAQARRDHADRA